MCDVGLVQFTSKFDLLFVHARHLPDQLSGGAACLLALGSSNCVQQVPHTLWTNEQSKHLFFYCDKHPTDHLLVMPKHIRDKREKEVRKRQKEKNRPIVVGSHRFVNVPALRLSISASVTIRIAELRHAQSNWKLVR